MIGTYKLLSDWNSMSEVCLLLKSLHFKPLKR